MDSRAVVWAHKRRARGVCVQCGKGRVGRFWRCLACRRKPCQTGKKAA